MDTHCNVDKIKMIPETKKPFNKGRDESQGFTVRV